MYQFNPRAYRYAYPLFRAHERTTPQKSSHKKRLHRVFRFGSVTRYAAAHYDDRVAYHCARLHAVEPNAACQRCFISCDKQMSDIETTGN